MGNNWKATSNSHHPEVWWLVFTASAVFLFSRLVSVMLWKCHFTFYDVSEGGGIVDLFLRELPLNVMVHVGSERERSCFCGLFKYTTSQQSLEEWLKKGRYSSFSSQDTCSCHYKSEPSLGGGPKGPTRQERQGYLFLPGIMQHCSVLKLPLGR